MVRAAQQGRSGVLARPRRQVRGPSSRRSSTPRSSRSPARVPVVCASGNNGTGSVIYPACLEETIAVGACNEKGWRATYSQYGRGLDLVAPSNDVPTRSQDAQVGARKTCWRPASSPSVFSVERLGELGDRDHRQPRPVRLQPRSAGGLLRGRRRLWLRRHLGVGGAGRRRRSLDVEREAGPQRRSGDQDDPARRRRSREPSPRRAPGWPAGRASASRRSSASGWSMRPRAVEAGSILERLRRQGPDHSGDRQRTPGSVRRGRAELAI